LTYLHTVHGIVHGNISSTNVLCDSGNTIFKISDIAFGVASGLGLACGVASGLACGHVPYWAPEVQKMLQSTKSSDVYAFGVLCSEVALNKYPTQERHQEDAQSIKWSELREIVQKCISIDPQSRESVEIVVEELNHLQLLESNIEG